MHGRHGRWLTWISCENIQVSHLPRLPCIEGLTKIRRGWTIRRSPLQTWKKWKMADLDIFGVGKTFQEIVCQRGWALTDPFKEDFLLIQEQLLHPNQDMQAGLGLSGRPWMRNPPSSKETKQITSSSQHKSRKSHKSHKNQSHPSNPSSHSH